MASEPTTCQADELFKPNSDFQVMEHVDASERKFDLLSTLPSSSGLEKVQVFLMLEL